MGLSVFDEQAPWWRTYLLADTDTPGDFSIAHTEVLPLRIDQVLIATDNTASIEVALEFSEDNATFVEVAHIAIPAGSGMTVGVAAVDLLEPVAGVLVDCVVPTTGGVRFAVIGALASGKMLSLFAKGGYI